MFLAKSCFSFWCKLVKVQLNKVVVVVDLRITQTFEVFFQKKKFYTERYFVMRSTKGEIQHMKTLVCTIVFLHEFELSRVISYNKSNGN